MSFLNFALEFWTFYDIISMVYKSVDHKNVVDLLWSLIINPKRLLDDLPAQVSVYAIVMHFISLR